MEALWALINVNQLIALIPLLRIAFPANAFLFFQVLGFINGDVYLLNEAYNLSLGRLLRFPPSSPFNSQFQDLGTVPSL